MRSNRPSTDRERFAAESVGLASLVLLQTRRVLPATRSRTKTSKAWLVSLGTRFEAIESKTTYRPQRRLGPSVPVALALVGSYRHPPCVTRGQVVHEVSSDSLVSPRTRFVADVRSYDPAVGGDGGCHCSRRLGRRRSRWRRRQGLPSTRSLTIVVSGPVGVARNQVVCPESEGEHRPSAELEAALALVVPLFLSAAQRNELGGLCPETSTSVRGRRCLIRLQSRLTSRRRQ